MTQSTLPFIAEDGKHDGKIAYVDTPEGQRLYSLRDWVYSVSASTNKNLSGPWSDLKKAIKRKGLESLLSRIQTHELQTPGGKQLSDFADEATLREIKTYIRQSRKNKATHETTSFHPLVIAFLKEHGWQTQHHLFLPSGKTIDIVAEKDENFWVVECKPNIAGQGLYLAIGQVLCYVAEYGHNSRPALATWTSQVSDYVQQMTAMRGIDLIALPG